MPARPDPTHTASELRIVLGHLLRRLRAESPLSLPSATVLSRLDREGASTTSALAAAEGVRPQSMAQTVAQLEEAKLVTRRPDPADRRQALVELTGLGRSTLAQERARREGWLAQGIATELTPAEQAVLVEAVTLLRRLSDA